MYLYCHKSWYVNNVIVNNAWPCKFFLRHFSQWSTIMGLILTFKNLVWESHTIQVCPLLYLSGTLSRGPLRPGKRYIMRCVGELFLHCCHNDDKREPAAAPNIHIANITFAVSDKSWCTIALLQFFVRGTKATTEKNNYSKKQTNTQNKQSQIWNM